MKQNTENNTDAETFEGQSHSAPSYSIEYEIDISEGEIEVDLLVNYLEEF